MKKLIISVGIFLVLGATTAWTKDSLSPRQMTPKCDPYTNYSCLDTYLGESILTRFWNYYILEIGHATAPPDPHAPSSHRTGLAGDT